MSAIATSRHFAAARKFGRFWIEADITAGFMSTRPRPRFILILVVLLGRGLISAQPQPY
jgi:hypothetical protein